jgi:hypothetical protein
MIHTTMAANRSRMHIDRSKKLAIASKKERKNI